MSNRNGEFSCFVFSSFSVQISHELLSVLGHSSLLSAASAADGRQLHPLLELGCAREDHACVRRHSGGPRARELVPRRTKGVWGCAKKDQRRVSRAETRRTKCVLDDALGELRLHGTAPGRTKVAWGGSPKSQGCAGQRLKDQGSVDWRRGG